MQLPYKRVLQLGLFAGCLFGFLAMPVHAQAGSSITVLPLGDSITYGETLDPASPGGGYRDPLYSLLLGEGVNVTYAGVNNGNPSAKLTLAGETANDGFGGYLINDIDENLSANNQPTDSTTSNLGGYWLKNASGGLTTPAPNVILLMAGTNDILFSNPNLPVATVASNILGAASGPSGPSGLLGLVADVHKDDPQATILVASPPNPIISSNWTAIATQLNLDMAAAIPADFAGENIDYVDMFDALNQYGDFKTPAGAGDGIHLSNLGYIAMAQKWNSAILADYDFNADPVDVPEPSTWALLVGGAVVLVWWGRRARRLSHRRS
jgi:lysophospholipase L1-like esterase